jgi:hypothetical protein
MVYWRLRKEEKREGKWISRLETKKERGEQEQEQDRALPKGVMIPSSMKASKLLEAVVSSALYGHEMRYTVLV